MGRIQGALKKGPNKKNAVEVLVFSVKRRLGNPAGASSMSRVAQLSLHWGEAGDQVGRDSGGGTPQPNIRKRGIPRTPPRKASRQTSCRRATSHSAFRRAVQPVRR